MKSCPGAMTTIRSSTSSPYRQVPATALLSRAATEGASGRWASGAYKRSHVFNYAREWGSTDRPNQCQGVNGFTEQRRDVHVDDATFEIVKKAADRPTRDAMMLACLARQRPADVLRTRLSDVKEGLLAVTQAKTVHKLRMSVATAAGPQQHQDDGDLRARPSRRPRQADSMNELRTGAAFTDQRMRERTAQHFDSVAPRPGLEPGTCGLTDRRARPHNVLLI